MLTSVHPTSPGLQPEIQKKKVKDIDSLCVLVLFKQLLLFRRMGKSSYPFTNLRMSLLPAEKKTPILGNRFIAKAVSPCHTASCFNLQGRPLNNIKHKAYSLGLFCCGLPRRRKPTICIPAAQAVNVHAIDPSPNAWDLEPWTSEAAL